MSAADHHYLMVTNGARNLLPVGALFVAGLQVIDPDKRRLSVPYPPTFARHHDLDQPLRSLRIMTACWTTAAIPCTYQFG
jgi:hypothetical protein